MFVPQPLLTCSLAMVCLAMTANASAGDAAAEGVTPAEGVPSISVHDFYAAPHQLGTGHSDVSSVVAVPGEELFVTGHEDGSLFLRSLFGGRAIVSFGGHTAAISSLAIESAGRLISSSEDGTLRVWNLRDGTCLWTLQTGQPTHSWMTCCTSTPDGRWVVGGGYDRTLWLWDLDDATGEAVALSVGDSTYLSVACAPDGAWFAAGNLTGEIHLWRMTTAGPLEERLVWSTEQGRVTALACLVEPARVVAVHASGVLTIRPVLETAEGLEWGDPRVLPADSSLVSLAVQPTLSLVAAGTIGGQILIWELPGDDPLERVERTVLSGHRGLVTGLAWSFEENLPVLVSAGEDRAFHLWRIKLPATPPLAVIPVPESRVWAVAVSRDGTRLALGGRGGHLAIHDLRTGERLHLVEGFPNTVDALAFSPDGTRLAVSSWKIPTLGVVDVASGELEPLRTLSGNGRQVRFSISGQEMFIATESRTLERVGPTGDQQVIQVSSELPTFAVDVSPDGQYVATGSGQWPQEVPGVIKLFRAHDLSEVATFSGHEQGVRSVVFHPREPLLASSDEGGQILVWDLTTRSILRTLQNPSGCRTIQFTPAGDHLAAGLKDSSIQVWDWRSGDMVQRCLAGDDIFDLCLSPDGTTLFAASGERQLFLWPLVGEPYSGTAADAAGWTLSTPASE